MSRLIRLDRTGHTTLAEWTLGDSEACQRATGVFERELEAGMLASAPKSDGSAEVVRQLPLDAQLVVMRRPISGG